MRNAPKYFRFALAQAALVALGAPAAVKGQDALELAPGGKELFLDDYLVKEMHNLRRVLHRPVKIRPEPVIRPEHPWDNLVVQCRNAPFWDPSARAWKLYYISFFADAGGTRNGGATCLAQSPDGLAWTKPELGLVNWEGSKANNIVTLHHWNEGGQGMLFHVLYDPRDIPERRYKGFFGIDGRQPAVSPDGLHWRTLDTPIIPSQDE